MSLIRRARDAWPFALGCGALGGGILTGYWTGQTSLGLSLPSVLAVGTAVSLTAAVCVAVRRPISTKTFVGKTAFVLFTLFMCAAVLGSSISAPAAWQLSPSDRMAGFVPYSDACSYYQQVLNWPAKTFFAWNSRRPLNATLNIMEFHLGGSTLLGMILVRVALAALAISAFIWVLASVAGRAAALTAGFVLLMWTWPYASSILSEINGISISAAGYALLLAALKEKRRTLAYPGLFALVLAYAFRPYNPLMPAFSAVAVLAGLATNWREGLKAGLFAAVTVSLVAVLLPKAIYLAYGHPDGGVNANTGTVVLGLARGTDWNEASEFVESQTPGLSERQRNARMYEMATTQMVENPWPALSKLAKNSLMSLYVFQTEFTATLGVPKPVVLGDKKARTLGRFFTASLSRPELWMGFLISTCSVVLLLLPRGVRRPEFPAPGGEVKVLFVATVISFVTVAPFIFADAGWRVVATLYAGAALLATGAPIGICRLRTSHRVAPRAGVVADVSTTRVPRVATLVSLSVVGFMLIAIPYPGLSRLLLGDVRPSTPSMILDIRDGETPHWTGLNRAVVAPRELRDWSIRQGYGSLTAFLARYGPSIQRVHFENGGYVLVSNRTSDPPDASLLRTDLMFQLRVVRE